MRSRRRCTARMLRVPRLESEERGMIAVLILGPIGLLWLIFLNLDLAPAPDKLKLRERKLEEWNRRDP